MPSLIGKGMESTSGKRTVLPRVKFRPNSPGETESNKDPGPSVSTLASPEGTSDIKDVIFSYAVSCRDGTVSQETLKQHVLGWVEQVHCRRGTGPWRAGLFVDFAACGHCQCLLNDPATIPCGHTYCKVCLSQLPAKSCLKCGRYLHHSYWTASKTNVVIAEVMCKWWPEELKAIQLKNDGNKLFLESEFDKAIEKYTQAFKIPSNRDHLLASNLSHAHLQIGQAVQAVQYAEATIKLRPDWPKGYFRKGSALLSLGRYEDAAVALIQCLALEPKLASVAVELTKVLHQIICSLCHISKPYLQSPCRGYDGRQSMPADAYGAQIANLRLLFESADSANDGTSDEEDDDSVSHTCSKRMRHNSSQASLGGFERLGQFLDRCQFNMDLLKKIDVKKVERTVSPELLDKLDFECTLCLRTFWEPVTTPCGHVFCRMCLDRCLDHSPRCPLCKSSLEDYLGERRQFITEFIDVAMQTYIPEAYAERKQSHQEEMNELTKNAEGSNREIPIFVCTVSFPTVPCPLHVFEPRYRLMIRRCLESGTRLFGMCSPLEGSHDTYSDYGTTLEIRAVHYFPDGRAVVDTVGRKRFRVLERNMRDGYHTATIEYLEDRADDGNETQQLHDVVHGEVLRWFRGLNSRMKNPILEHFGPMPDAEADYSQLTSGPAWAWWTLAILPLDARAQLTILAMTSLKKRLEALHHTLSYILKRNS